MGYDIGIHSNITEYVFSNFEAPDLYLAFPIVKNWETKQYGQVASQI